MELLDWDEKHRYHWKWICIACEKEGVIVTRIIANCLIQAEEWRKKAGTDMVPIVCAHCNADALIIEKVNE